MSGNKKASDQASYTPSGRGFGGGGMNRFAPKAKARDTKKILKKLLSFYIKEGRLLFLVFIFLLASTAILLYVPTLVGKAVNALSGDFEIAATLGIIILVAYLFDWLFTTLQGVFMVNASMRIVKALRRDLFDKMQKLPLTYHDARPHGELMSRLTNDIDNISNTIAASTSHLINAIVTVIGSSVLMFLLSPILFLVTFITMPLVFFLTRFIAKRTRIMFIGQQRELGNLNGMVEETISGLRMVKAFNKEDRMIQEFNKTNAKLLTHSVNAQIWSGFLMPFMNVITNLGYVFIAGVGGVLAVKGMIEVGTIASFISYTRLFVRPLNDIAGTFNVIQSALAGAERVFDILEEKEEKEDAPNATELINPRGEVEFNLVDFSYVEGTKVLNNVSFSVKAGQTAALVGKTGAGKTTIANLLTRFYEATQGTILIDGKSIESYTKDSLRRAFTVVLQDTCLFTGTIAENIRYGKPDATNEEIIAAAEAANADPFIRRLPQGYQTVVSASVDSLSQGQRQLIAIARAVLCQAPILILDEATSSVDTSTELKIQDALLKFREGRTSFVIAHRLSTIKDADIIMVIENGQIIEQGVHQELFDLNGSYAKMVATVKMV